MAIASHLRTFGSLLRYPQERIVAALLHDVREDYDVSDEEIRCRFGDLVADAVGAMTKTWRGATYSEVEVFSKISSDPIASVVTVADRVYNHSSMLGVFSYEKIASYVDETRTYFLPMLTSARRSFGD